MRRNALKRMISDYILIQAEIALSFGIVGSIFAKDVSSSFSYFLLPAIIGLLCIIPCIITYVKEDLTVKQIMIQRIVEWIVLEVAFITFFNTHYIINYLSPAVFSKCIALAQFIKWRQAL